MLEKVEKVTGAIENGQKYTCIQQLSISFCITSSKFLFNLHCDYTIGLLFSSGWILCMKIAGWFPKYWIWSNQLVFLLLHPLNQSLLLVTCQISRNNHKKYVRLQKSIFYVGVEHIQLQITFIQVFLDFFLINHLVPISRASSSFLISRSSSLTVID